MKRERLQMQTEGSTEPIDAGRTEATGERGEREEARGKREKKAKGSIDWAPIRKDWSRGLPVAQIAKEHGIKEMTIYSQAHRHRWPKREAILKGKIAVVDPKQIAEKAVEKGIEKAVAEQEPVIKQVVREKLNAWFQRILTTTDKLQTHVDLLADGRLEVEELKSLASTVEVVDRVARRTFGLDSPSGSSVSVFSVSAPTVQCPIIDVEPIPEQVPASVS